MLARPMAITRAWSPIGRETGTFTAPDHGRQKHWTTPHMRGHDASVLWRSLREVMPLSVAFLDGDHVEVIYPRHRELRAWPSWEVLELVRAEPAAMPDDEMAGRITQALGGHVVSTSIGPAGLAAALWTQDSYPPWYHVVIWSGSLQAMTPSQVRIWGAPCWSASGELAVTAFDGIRRALSL
jgi:hypothetical protein